MKPGDRVDNRYEIRRLLGQGGMGAVFEAHDLALDKPVALKTLLPQALGDLRSSNQLKREVRLSQDLRHECICATYHLEVGSSEPYIVMEFIDGVTLSDFVYGLPNHRCDDATFLRFAQKILDAVGHAHRAGVIHRDLKSSNIMVTAGGGVRIMDFGIAASLKENIARTTNSQNTLSIHYASPEQISGESPSPSMDIYSLGCVFYEMLSGRPPFTHGDVLFQQINKAPESLQGCHPKIASAVASALRKERSQRPSSAEGLAAALGVAPGPPTPSVAGVARGSANIGWNSQKIGVAAAAFASLLGLVLVGWNLMRSGDAATSPRISSATPTSLVDRETPGQPPEVHPPDARRASRPPSAASSFASSPATAQEQRSAETAQPSVKTEGVLARVDELRNLGRTREAIQLLEQALLSNHGNLQLKSMLAKVRKADEWERSIREEK